MGSPAAPADADAPETPDKAAAAHEASDEEYFEAGEGEQDRGMEAGEVDDELIEVLQVHTWAMSHHLPAASISIPEIHKEGP